MKITIILDCLEIGGTELNATRTLEAFGRRDLQVTVVHFAREGPLRERIAAAGHKLVHVPLVPLWSPRIAGRVLSLARILRSAGSTVVHTQDVYSNIVGIAAGRFAARLPVLTSRRWKDDVPRKVLTPLNAWAHRQSTLVLPNSPALVSTLAAEGVQASRIAVHENFVDDTAFTMLGVDARTRWRKEIGIPDFALVIGCVARLARVKRHDVLLDAFRHVAAVLPSAVLVLVGDGPARDALMSRTEAVGLSERVFFTGTLPNSPLPQQLFDLAVLTSENEGFPNSLVEASACGVPIVATKVGGIPDVLIEGVTGLAVDVGDAQGTALAMLALLTDATRRYRLGAAALAHAKRSFSEAAAVTRLLGIYRRASRT